MHNAGICDSLKDKGSYLTIAWSFSCIEYAIGGITHKINYAGTNTVDLYSYGMRMMY